MRKGFASISVWQALRSRCNLYTSGPQLDDSHVGAIGCANGLESFGSQGAPRLVAVYYHVAPIDVNAIA